MKHVRGILDTKQYIYIYTVYIYTHTHTHIYIYTLIHIHIKSSPFEAGRLVVSEAGGSESWRGSLSPNLHRSQKTRSERCVSHSAGLLSNMCPLLTVLDV